MAYEVFDDLAFSYLSASFLAVFLLPWTYIKITRELRKRSKVSLTPVGTDGPNALLHPSQCPCAECAKKLSTLSAAQNESFFQRYCTLSNLLFVLGWIFLMMLVFQIRASQGAELASFKPFEILELDHTASEAQIKKAYRKLSLKYHPDKNVNNPEAAQKFILISKAYATLTDPVAKENIEKYGNPDGFQGVSVTIGLPSFLTKKENEMRILFVYFLIFLVIPPVVVYLWWRRAKLVTDAGVFTRSIQAFYFLINPNMGPKQLIELLAVSEENSAAFVNWTQQQEMDYQRLFGLVKENMVKQKFHDPTGKKLDPRARYIHRASVLLHAHLLRVEVPKSLQPALRQILESAPKLLNAMTESALHRGFLRCLFGVIDLMQLLTQAMWPHDSPLLQLPHFEPEHVKALNRKNIYTIGGFRRTVSTPEGKEKVRQALNAAKLEFTDSQWTEIYLVADLFPELGLNYSYGVEDESSVCEGDIVTVKVDLERLKFDAERPEDTARRSITEEGEEDETAEGKAEEAASPKRSKAVTSAKKAASPSSSKKDAEKTSDAPESALGGEPVSGSSSSAPLVASSDGEVYLDEDLTEDELLDRMPTAPKKDLFQDRVAPLVHATRFPFEKRERWTLFLIQKGKKAPKLVTFSKVPQFLHRDQVKLKFQAPAAAEGVDGVFDYELHALCDSYVGCDKLVKFSIPIQKRKPIADEKLAAEPPVIPKSWLAQMMEDDPNYEGKWYFMGFATFWEMVLNLVVLGLLCVFIFNFLFSRGYWQRYVQPSVDATKNVLHPYWQIVEPFVAPVSTPVITAVQGFILYMADKLHAEPPPPKRRTAARTERAEKQAQEDEEARKAAQEAEAAARAAERKQGTDDEPDEDDEAEAASATQSEKPAEVEVEA